MTIWRAIARFFYACLLCGSIVSVSATENITYTYDELGRLVATSITGTVNNGQSTSTGFDPAGNRTNYTVGGAGAVISINSVSVNEGGALTFTVSRTGSTAAAVNVNYETADGTATSASDYTSTSGTLTIPINAASATITVNTAANSVIEADETLTVTLTAPTGGATLGAAIGTATIVNDDMALTIANAAVTEGGQLSFTVTRTGATAQAVSASYSTANGSAIAPADYASVTGGVVSIGAGATTGTILIATTDDALSESNETLSVALSAPTGGATLGSPATATGTINDNDAAPVITIANASVTEGGTLQFTVSRTGATGAASSATVTVTGGTAASGTDFAVPAATVTIPAGATTATFSIATVADSIVEADETIVIALSAPSGATLGAPSTATGTILNDDASFAVSAGPAVTEGGGLTFTVTKTGSVSSNLSVNYATGDGSAWMPGDYTATSGTLTFTPGQSSLQVTVPTIDDATVEVAETVALNLSGATGGATITTAQAVGTINDNDVAPATLAISNAPTVTEGGVLVFTVTRSGNTGIAASASFTAVNGTALSGSDYTANSGTVSFAAGETSKQINVVTTDDAGAESQENLAVTLSAPGANTTITTATATGLINDNDPSNQPPVANPNSASVYVCSVTPIDVLANDTDPEGNLPLTLLSVGQGAYGTTSVVNNKVQYEAGTDVGVDNLSYTVSDSLGATSTGTLQVAVFAGGGQCGQ